MRQEINKPFLNGYIAYFILTLITLTNAVNLNNSDCNLIDGLQRPDIISDKFIYGGPNNCTKLPSQIRDRGSFWSTYVTEEDLISNVRPRIAIDLTEGGLYPPVFVKKIEIFGNVAELRSWSKHYLSAVTSLDDACQIKLKNGNYTINVNKKISWIQLELISRFGNENVEEGGLFKLYLKIWGCFYNCDDKPQEISDTCPIKNIFTTNYIDENDVLISNQTSKEFIKNEGKLLIDCRLDTSLDLDLTQKGQNFHSHISEIKINGWTGYIQAKYKTNIYSSYHFIESRSIKRCKHNIQRIVINSQTSKIKLVFFSNHCSRKKVNIQVSVHGCFEPIKGCKLIDGLANKHIIPSDFIYGGPRSSDKIGLFIRSNQHGWSSKITMEDIKNRQRPNFVVDLTHGNLYPPPFIRQIDLDGNVVEIWTWIKYKFNDDEFLFTQSAKNEYGGKIVVNIDQKISWIRIEIRKILTPSGIDEVGDFRLNSRLWGCFYDCQSKAKAFGGCHLKNILKANGPISYENIHFGGSKIYKMLTSQGLTIKVPCGKSINVKINTVGETGFPSYISEINIFGKGEIIGIKNNLVAQEIIKSREKINTCLNSNRIIIRKHSTNIDMRIKGSNCEKKQNNVNKMKINIKGCIYTKKDCENQENKIIYGKRINLKIGKNVIKINLRKNHIKNIISEIYIKEITKRKLKLNKVTMIIRFLKKNNQKTEKYIIKKKNITLKENNNMICILLKNVKSIEIVVVSEMKYDVKVLIKSGCEKIKRTTTTEHQILTTTNKRKTTLKPCAVKLVSKDGDLTKITVKPKISKKDIGKLRPDWKHPKQGVEFKPGKHTIVVNIVKGTRQSKPNRITSVGLKVISVNPADKLSKYFKSVTIVIHKRKFIKRNVKRTVKKTIKVSLKTIIDDLKNVLKKPHHYVKKVIVKFEVTKVIKVKLMIKGCVDKVKVPPTTKRPIPTPTRPGQTATRLTSISPCRLENLITSPYFTDFKFFPNITNCEYKKLRFGNSEPNIGVSLICGSHSISIFVKRDDSYVTANFISHLSFLILNSSSSDFLDKYFEYFDIVFTRHLIGNAYLDSNPSIHVENIPLSFSLDYLSNIPSYFHRNIESIRFDFKLKLNVVIKLVVKGCVDSIVPIISSSIAPPIVNNEFFKCSNVKDLLPSSSLFKIVFNPYLPNIDINDSRFHKKGITLSTGFYSFSFSLPNNQSLNIIELGVLLFDGDDLRLSDDIFEFTEVSAIRLFKSFGRLLFRKLSIPIPDNINFKGLQNVLPFGLTNINKIIFKFVLKKSWKIAFRIQGCKNIESVFLSSKSPLTSTVPALVNKESFTCTNLINLLRKINKFVTKVKPPLSESEIRKLSSRGSVLPKGLYSIEMSLPHGESLNIIAIGILLHDENQGRYINSMIKVVKLIVSRLSRSFGKVISRNVKLSIPDNISVRDLQNLLSGGLTNINKIMLKFYLKKPLKASINIKGCKDSEKVLFTTTLSPTPIVNDESYKCTLIRNVLQDLSVIQMDIIPSISTSELNKLRGVSALPNNGARLSKALYSMKITPGLGQTLNIIELGIIIQSEDENKPMMNVIKSIDVEISRLVYSFGKYKETKRHMFISDDLSIKDLKNILISKLTAITNVYITVELKREVKAQINLKGCSSFDSTTTLLTTLTPVVNDESFTCNKNVNIIKLRSIVKLSKVPPLPPIDNIRLRYSSILSNIGAPIIKGKHEIKISLPEGEKGTIIDFGLNFLGENNSTFAWRFIKNITITAYRLRMSFGVLKSSPMKIGLPKEMTVGHLKNILQRPLTEVNKIFIEFVTLKRTYLNIRMNGCFSKKVLKTTTLPPVGCLHLNKYYSHGQIIADKFACDSKICSDGRTLPIIICNKKWTQWKKCSKFCGAGETSRRQICVINPMIRSIDKQNLIKQMNETCFNKIEVKPCFEQPCQESCKLTEWSDWSPCNNNTCVDEYQTRLRQLITTSKNTPCTKPLMESQRCIKPQCPCTENAVLHDCANILCPTSCDHMNQLVKCVSNNKNCIKSCVCKFGYLYQNGVCVQRSQCFCLKPDFNKLMLSTTSSATNNQGSTTMSPGGTNQGNSGSNQGSVSLTSNQNSATTTRSSSIGFTVLLKKELQDLNKNKQITPPWGPGITNRPFYTATFPWFPGTTPAGVTIKLPSDSTTRIPIKTPPVGLTLTPPDSVTKTSSTLKYYITKPYKLPESNQNANQNQNPSQSPEIREPQMTMLTSPPSVESSNHKQGSNQNSQSPVTDQSGNTRTNINGNNKNTITQFPNFSRQTTIKSYINANSTFIVDCQSCVCTNGRLICSGPQCFAGTNTWSDWSTWSPCTGICGIGIRRRFRQCQGANCKDNSVAKSGLIRFMATNQIQAEDKQCLIKECSCVFSRELFKIHISEAVITKFNIDLKAVWIEKDNIKGLSHSKEIVESGEIIPSGIVANVKCTQCTCKNGRFDCVIQCS